MPASAPDNPAAAQLAEAIRAALPADQRAALADEITLAAQLLAGLPADQRGPEQLRQALDAAGLTRLRAVLDFSGGQFGDLSFGDIAGHDIIKPTITIHQAKLSYEEQQAQRNRAKLLDLVQRVWVAGLLHTSLHQRVLIELGIQTLPDLVHQPWKHIVCLPGQPPRPLPPGTSIGTVFAQAGRQLLILGAPGGGKTTTLLSLAEQLIAEAQADPTLPIPVVFQLSTWAVGKPKLADWLVTELQERYKVPPKLGQAWVESGAILPLLDGLDEVGPSDVERAACVRAINVYLGDSGAQAAVCSRTAEYAQLDATLALETAIQIQPLEPAQVDDYLARCGPALAGLRGDVAVDATLGELAASPLLLSVLALAYRDTPAAALVGQEREAAYQRLWADYVNRRLALKRADARQTEPEQLRAWLTWLARGMQAHGQQIFYIEYLQASWLATKGQRRLFRLLSILGLGLVFGLIGGLGSGLVFGLIGGLGSGLVFGLTGALGLGIIGGLREGMGEIRLTETLSWDWRGTLNWQRIRSNRVSGLMFGLIGGLVGIRLGNWSGSLVGALVGSLVGGLVGGMIGVLGFGLVDGLKNMLKEDEIQSSTQPNEGIRRSQRSMLIGGIVGSMRLILILGLGLSLGYNLFIFLFGGWWIVILGGSIDVGMGVRMVLQLLIFGLIASLITGLPISLPVGLIIGMLQYGGVAVIKHYLLRMLLRLRCGAPRDIAAALDEAVSRDLMTRVGGGYRFSHQLLQEHFAEHEAPELPVAAILGPKPGDYTGGRRDH